MNIFNSNQDLFQKTTKDLYFNPEFKCNPRQMFIYENIGFSARINNCLDRLLFIPERKWDIVYGTGEFLWYITGSDSLDFISYYAPSYDRFSDDNETLYGAYGKRIFKNNKNDNDSFHIENGIGSVIRKLRLDPDSRQAIALIWQKKDMHVNETKDLPCTINLQFLIRDNKLHMITNMRSNDVWLGSTNDIYCFTLIQELVASELGIDLGFYQHNSGSMHLYEKNIEKIKSCENSIFSNYDSLPMKKIDSFKDQIKYLINYEKKLRTSDKEIHYKECFNKKVLNELSDGITDLMHILYYGKIRKLYKKQQKELFYNKLNETFEKIKDIAIKKCISIYEEL